MATAQITITDKEKEEFDTITYDKINSIKDVEKLRRCEHYMRTEGFPQTADAVRARLQQLGSSAMGEMSADERQAATRELDNFLNELSAWESNVKKADGQLRDKQRVANGGSSRGGDVRQLPSGTAGAERGVVQGDPEQPRNAREVVEKANRKRAESKAKAARRPKDVRSGGEYYREWDRIADEALMESGSSDEEEEEDSTTTTGDAVADPDIKLAERLIRSSEKASAPAEDPSLSRIRHTAAEKVLKALEGAPQVEREYQARIEKEKGNEYFRAKEYSAAVDAYTLSLQLQPSVAAVHTNRSMAYFKLKRWHDAETDGTFALDIDPTFVKGYVRRGSARMELGSYAGAVEDFTKALELMPGDKEIQTYLAKAQRKLDAERKPAMRQMAVEEVEEVEEGAGAAGAGEAAKATVPAPAPTPAVSAPPALASSPSAAAKPLSVSGQEGKAAAPAAPHAGAATSSAGAKAPNGVSPGTAPVEPFTSNASTAAASPAAGEQAAKAAAVKGAVPAPAAVGAAGVSKGSHAATRKERAEHYKEKGNQLFKRAKYEEAELCYTQCLAWDPTNVPALNNRGVCRLKMQDFVGAEMDCSEVLEVDPQNIKALHRRASARYELERIPDALADIDALTQMLPEGHPSAQEVEKLAAQIHSKAYVPKRTGKMVIKEVDSDDELDEAAKKRQLAELKHEARRMAQEQAARAVVKEEMTREAGVRAADLEAALKRKEEAARKVDEHQQRIGGGNASAAPAATRDTAAAASPPACAPEGSAAAVAASEAEKEKGNELFKKGWFDDAIACYSRSLDLRPGNAAVLSNRAMCYLKLERWSEAEEDGSRCIAADPHFFKGYHRRAVALKNQGRLEEALEDYKVVLKHAGSNKAVMDEVSALRVELQQRAARDASGAGAGQGGAGAPRAAPKGTKIMIEESEGSDEEGEEEEDDTDDERWAREAAAAAAAGNKAVAVERRDGAEGAAASPARVADAAATGGAAGSPSVLKGSYAVAAEAAKEAVLQKMMASLPVPKSSSEFEKACQVFKGDDAAMANYLQRVPVDQYRKIFGDSLTPPVIASIVHALKGGYMPSDPAGAAVVLQSLASVNRFATTVMLLGRSDKAVLAEVFDQLLAAGVKNVDVPALRKTFRV
eukprot:jgi/Mesvir1/18999/Mv18959-RA.1